MKIKGQRHVLVVLLSLAKNHTCFHGNVTTSAQKLVLIIFDSGGRDKTGLQFENFQALTVYFGVIATEKNDCYFLHLSETYHVKYFTSF